MWYDEPPHRGKLIMDTPFDRERRARQSRRRLWLFVAFGLGVLAHQIVMRILDS